MKLYYKHVSLKKEGVRLINATQLLIGQCIFSLISMRLQAEEHKALWHYSFPTTGLHTDPRYFSASSPFLPHRFTLWQLAPRLAKGVRIVVIDTQIEQKQGHHNRYSVLQSHGIHTSGLIAAPLKGVIKKGVIESFTATHGLSPRVQVIILNIFDHRGISDKAKLVAAITKAVALKADILLLGLKLDDTLDPSTPLSRHLNELLKKIPYVVAAAGNDRPLDSNIETRAATQLAYPARFDGVTFSVGAFGIHDTGSSVPECFIPYFSQRERGRGPTFLAPGVNILSTGPGQSSLMLSGTSPAAALVAAFLALVLGEFRDSFSKHEIEAVLKQSTIRPHNTAQWQESGILDMRTALFSLHLLKALRKKAGLSRASLYENCVRQQPDLFTDFIPSLRENSLKLQSSIRSLRATLRRAVKNILKLQGTNKVFARATAREHKKTATGALS